jgi:hypothetical protein
LARVIQALRLSDGLQHAAAAQAVTGRVRGTDRDVNDLVFQVSDPALSHGGAMRDSAHPGTIIMITLGSRPAGGP